MKFVRESLLEFERGIDPKHAMGTGIITKMKDELDKIGLSPDEYTIEPDLKIKVKKLNMFDTLNIDLIYFKFVEPQKFQFLLKIKDPKHNTIYNTRSKQTYEEAIDEAIKDGISINDIKQLLEKWADPHNINKQGLLYLQKRTRSKKDIKYDKEYNRYIFIGYMGYEKVKGTEYSKPKLKTEAIIKIDPFKLESHQAIQMLKTRARMQYANENADVYIVHIPVDLMDEDRYDEIPPECQYIFEKYKQKI